jgi:hypothetical protein
MKNHEVAICVENKGYEASLEIRKVYDLIKDEEAAERDLLRVVDESGDDYLFPKEFFLVLDLPSPLHARLSASA